MSAIDKDTLAQLVEDISLADVRRIAAVFRGDLGRLLPIAERSAASGDLAAWHRTLHSIAGASGALGGLALEAAARRGMALGKADPSAMVAGTALLTQLAEQTMRELESCLEELVGAP